MCSPPVSRPASPTSTHPLTKLGVPGNAFEDPIELARWVADWRAYHGSAERAAAPLSIPDHRTGELADCVCTTFHAPSIHRNR